VNICVSSLTMFVPPNAPVQWRAAQRTVRCNRLLGRSVMLAGLLSAAAKRRPIEKA